MTDEPSAVKAAFARQRAAMLAPDLSAPERVVLIVLAIMANADAEAWPPIRGGTGLASRCSLGERTVARALRGLEDAGHVSTRRVEGKGSIYSVHPCHSGRGSDPDCTPATAAPLPERQGTPATAATKQPRTTNISRERRSTARSAEFAGIAALTDLPPLPASASASQWADYAALRVDLTRGAKPRPWTRSIARKAIEKLHDLASAGHDAGDALNASVLNGWQGIFPPKENRDASRRDPSGRSQSGSAADAMRSAFARVDVG